MARVVVIGAGMAGLSTAILTRAAGHEVTLLEAGPVVGGKLNRFHRDGFSFDTGPSVFTWPQVYQEIFAAAGAELTHFVNIRRVEPGYDYRFCDGSKLLLPGGDVESVCGAIASQFGIDQARQWRRLMGRSERIFEATRGPFLENELQGRAALAGLSLRLRDALTVAPWHTARSLTQRLLSDPRLQMMADRYCTYTGSDPRQAPAALLSIPHVESAFGVWYPDGGLYQLAQASLSLCASLGVSVRTQSKVTKVRLEGQRVHSVVLEGGESLPADVVVSGVDVAQLVRDLVPPSAVRSVAPTFDQEQASLSGFVLLLAVRGRTQGLAHHTVSFPQNYDNEFDEVFGVGRCRLSPRPVVDPTVYISAPDDPSMRPDDGHESWFVLVNAPRHHRSDSRWGINWNALETNGLSVSENYAEQVLAVMQRRGLLDRRRVLWHEVISPADLEASTGSAGGAIYGQSSNGLSSAFLRPRNTTGIKGLFLTGGSAHPGGGLPLVGLSAQIVARQIGRA